MAIYIPHDHTEEDTQGSSTLGHAFLQERVAVYALCGFLMGMIFFLFRSVISLATGRLPLSHPSLVFHMLGLSGFLWVWLVARRGRYRIGIIHLLDHAATFISTTCYLLMSAWLPIGFRPDYVLIISMTYILITRSTLVPGTSRRTAAIAAVMGTLLVVGTYVIASRADLSGFPPYVQHDLAPATCAVRVAAWWLVTTTLAVITSYVIYGLQREIHRARRLGQYTLEEKLGEGGMGVVYRARHATLRRPTAVKLLAPEKAGAVTIARFEREVRLTARLTHPNTVTIYDYGRTPEGVFYYAMELLDGFTLEEMVDEFGAQPPGRVVHIASQIASALSEAHEQGLIHRDIKPANVILCRRGGMGDVVKVVDFGLVKDLESHTDSLTQAGSVSGTPLYLAPEAIRAPDTIDARADLYALGAVMYYLLAGDHVFRAPTIVEVCAHHVHSLPAPIAERCPTAIGPELASLVMACLAKDPGLRPRSADEVLERLQATAEAGAWSVPHARTWWSERAGRLLAKRAIPDGAGRSTLTIDLASRE